MGWVTLLWPSSESTICQRRTLLSVKYLCKYLTTSQLAHSADKMLLSKNISMYEGSSPSPILSRRKSSPPEGFPSGNPVSNDANQPTNNSRFLLTAAPCWHIRHSDTRHQCLDWCARTPNRCFLPSSQPWKRYCLLFTTVRCLLKKMEHKDCRRGHGKESKSEARQERV